MAMRQPLNYNTKIEFAPEEKFTVPKTQVAPEEQYGAEDTGTKRPCGRVVGIIRRNWRERGYCGSLKPTDRSTYGTSSVMFMPIERRFPMVRITTRQADTLMDKRLVVVIDGWDIDSMYPTGHYVRTLGTIGDKDVETEVILIENDVNTSSFTPAVHEPLPNGNFEVGVHIADVTHFVRPNTAIDLEAHE
eukprot:gene31430-6606_t